MSKPQWAVLAGVAAVNLALVTAIWTGAGVLEGIIERAFAPEPIHRAAARGDTQALAKMLERGVDVNEQNQHGVTALHVAPFEGHTETVALLLDRGADVNARDEGDLKPLHLAAFKGHAATVALLSERGGVA